MDELTPEQAERYGKAVYRAQAEAGRWSMLPWEDLLAEGRRMYVASALAAIEAWKKDATNGDDDPS